MNNTQLRDSLLIQADTAFYALADQVDDLLDSAKFYADQYPPKSPSDKLKTEQLNIAIKEMGQLLKSIALEIERWKKEEERVLSKLGVELQFINELKATMEALMLFFIREDIPLARFSLALVTQSHAELLRCNRLL